MGTVHADDDAPVVGVIVAPTDAYTVDVIPADYAPGMLLINALVGMPVISGASGPADRQRANRRYADILNHPENALPDLTQRVEASAASHWPGLDDKLQFIVLDEAPLKWGKPDFKAIGEPRPDHLIVLHPNAGLATAPTKGSGATPFVSARFEVYDARRKKRLFKGRSRRHGQQWVADVEQAAYAPDALIEALTPLTQSVLGDIYHQMHRQDVLHRMARKSTLADHYPSIKALLAEHAQRFELKQPMSKALFYRKPKSPYVHTVAPIRHKQAFGMVTTIDLLHPALGQGFDAAAPFIDVWLARLANVGWATGEQRDNDVLAVDGPWASYVLPNPGGGISVFFHRKVSDFVLTHRVDFTGSEPDRMRDLFSKVAMRYVEKTRLVIR